ncbi:MAG: PHP domain-containing protein [Archaeoglobus sp.]|uniref:PHP domain-containing protein n=1 Tax=Archaeoglobus sp. TaxID=1872626 RepID=UPI001E19E85E|nr:PHP domain-containing protein [Archaeoglobus sp.]MBO8178889.1 PHP domain-containing protein [Archaeoglobus sp.]
MLKAELHVHSSISDGKDGVRKILNAAMEKKIDVISITDHDTVQGSLEALDIVEEEKLPIKILPGCEITSSSGHILAFGIIKDVEPKMSAEETCRVVRELGGVCFLAHPFDFIRGGSVRLKDFRIVDGVETFNAKSYFNFMAKRYAKKFSKPEIAGSDAHSARAVGLAVNYLPDNINLIESIFHARYDGKRVSIRERLAFLLFQLSQRL